MDSERTATKPNQLAGSPEVTEPTAESAAEVNHPQVTAPVVWRTVDSPTLAISAGIIAPIICFSLQPILLPRDVDTVPGLRFINTFWLFGYGITGLEMLILSLRLAFRSRLGAWNGPVAGMLLAGALFAGGLGVVLLPFSLIGLFILIGILGFVPFLTAIVYAMSAIDAYRDARKVTGGARLIGSAFPGALLVIGVPSAAQAQVALALRSATRDVANGDPTALAKLRVWYRFGPADSLVWSYEAEHDPVRRQRLAKAYEELTGTDIESRRAALSD